MKKHCQLSTIQMSWIKIFNFNQYGQLTERQIDTKFCNEELIRDFIQWSMQFLGKATEVIYLCLLPEYFHSCQQYWNFQNIQVESQAWLTSKIRQSARQASRKQCLYLPLDTVSNISLQHYKTPQKWCRIDSFSALFLCIYGREYMEITRL